MSSSNAAKNGLLALIMGGVCIAVIVLGASLVNSNSKENKIRNCESNGEVYDEHNRSCREKTVSEKFNEKCSSSVIIGDKTYSCNDIRKAGLQSAYLTNKLTQHSGVLYESGTSAEIAAGKNAGDYCLTAADSWSHIGEKRCVVFSYEYMACSNGYCFLDEKQNYNSGFVAFFGKYNMYSWEGFRSTYYGKGPILVCGQIYAYNGHPEIKITDVGSQTRLSPQASYSGGNIVYRYSCN